MIAGWRNKTCVLFVMFCANLHQIINQLAVCDLLDIQIYLLLLRVQRTWKLYMSSSSRDLKPFIIRYKHSGCLDFSFCNVSCASLNRLQLFVWNWSHIVTHLIVVLLLKAYGSVVSNWIRMKFGRNVLPVNTHWLIESNFLTWPHTFKMAAITSFPAEKCWHLVMHTESLPVACAAVSTSSWPIVVVIS